MQGLTSIISRFRIEFDKFNNTRARMSDSTYQIMYKKLRETWFAVEPFRFQFNSYKKDIVKGIW